MIPDKPHAVRLISRTVEPVKILGQQDKRYRAQFPNGEVLLLRDEDLMTKAEATAILVHHLMRLKEEINERIAELQEDAEPV